MHVEVLQNAVLLHSSVEQAVWSHPCCAVAGVVGNRAVESSCTWLTALKGTFTAKNLNVPRNATISTDRLPSCGPMKRVGWVLL